MNIEKISAELPTYLNYRYKCDYCNGRHHKLYRLMVHADSSYTAYKKWGVTGSYMFDICCEYCFTTVFKHVIKYRP